MLKQRVITAVLLLPLVGIILFAINLSMFAAALLVIVYLMALEWGRLSGIAEAPKRSIYAFSVAAIGLAIWYFAPPLYLWPSTWFIEFHFTTTLMAYWLSVVGWLLAIVMISVSKAHRSFWATGYLPRLLLGIVLMLGFWVSVVAIRGAGFTTEDWRGGAFVLYMLIIIWGVDIGGYFFGKAFGKRKLAPSVSPGKTWAGALGGVLLAEIVAFSGVWLLDLSITSYWLFAAIIVGIASISIYGDLLESLLKREVSIKDSSNLLPGHGGLLDRLDSTLAVAPFFLLMAKAQGWF